MKKINDAACMALSAALLTITMTGFVLIAAIMGSIRIGYDAYDRRRAKRNPS